MVDIVISIIDRLIQLLALRGEINEKHFENIIKPIYEDAESIYLDYLKTFDELSNMIQGGINEEQLIRFIETRRLEYLPVRVKVRALLARVTSPSNRRYGRTPLFRSSDNFIDGVWHLMQGGLSIVEPGHMQVADSPIGPHTLLDILYHFLYSGEERTTEQIMERGLAAIHDQVEHLHKAWQMVAEGYAEKADAVYGK